VSKTNPADPFVTIACSHPADPAIDWSAKNAQEAVLEHARRRTRETLDKIPVRDGEHLTLVEVRALTHGELRSLERLRSAGAASPFDVHEGAASMAIEALSCGPSRYEVPKRDRDGAKIATEDGAEELWSRLGMVAIEELGALAMQRGRLRDAGPFALPAGVTLGRPPR
jgi:hypothetical protein